MTPGNHSVLVVDDVLENIQVLGGLLELEGYEVRVCNSGTKALEMVQSTPPDLILLDVIMPDLDGLEVCRRLKAKPQTAAIPIIFLTGLAQEVTQVASLDLGAVDYITKPFNLEVVRRRIQLQLSLRDLQKRLESQNEELENLVTQRTQELVEANRRLTKLDWTKTTYLRLLFQDLQGPTNGLIGITQLALANVCDEDKRSRFQALFEQLRHRFDETFTNCKTLTSVQGAEGNGPPRPVRLTEVLGAVADRLSTLARDQFLNSLKVDRPSSIIDGDRGILVHALTSLWQFAIQAATGEPSPLEVVEEGPWTKLELRFPSSTHLDPPMPTLDDLLAGNLFPEAAASIGLNLPLAGVILDAVGGRLEWKQGDDRLVVMTVLLRRFTPS